MKMTKIGMAAMVCGLMLAGMNTTHAQGVAKGKRGAGLRGKQAGAKHQGAMAQLLQQLNLTADQKKQIMGIEASAKQKRASILQNASLSADQKKAQEKALGKATRKQVVAVLTPAQKQQLKQLLAERRQMKGGKGATAAPSTPPTPASPAPKTGANTPANGSAPVTAGAKSEDDELDGLDELA